MAMSADGDGLDQFEEGKSVGGHAGEVEAIPYTAVAPSMITELEFLRADLAWVTGHDLHRMQGRRPAV
jgi:hypothetical protein